MQLRTSFTRTLMGIAIFWGTSSANAEIWTVTNLHPAGSTGSAESWALGVSGGQQVGVAQVLLAPGESRSTASLWTGTAGSWVDLHPADPVYLLSSADGVGGGQQVGTAEILFHGHAALWSGTADSFVDLNPPGLTDSAARAVSGGQQVGHVWVNGTPRGDGIQRAAMWSGTAASWVDLTPDVAFSGEATGISDGQQVGQVYIDGVGFRASLWTGTATSWVDLTPAAYPGSSAYGVSGGQQVGIVIDDAHVRASLWTSTADSWVDLHPAGSSDSEAHGVFGGQQVGWAQVGSETHASLWSGTADSWVDLHAYLPAGFTESVAQSIWSDGSFNYVAGFAYKDLGNLDGHQEAMLWRQPVLVPEPSCIVLFGFTVPAMLCLRRRPILRRAARAAPILAMISLLLVQTSSAAWLHHCRLISARWTR